MSATLEGFVVCRIRRQFREADLFLSAFPHSSHPATGGHVVEELLVELVRHVVAQAAKLLV